MFFIPSCISIFLPDIIFLLIKRPSFNIFVRQDRCWWILSIVYLIMSLFAVICETFLRVQNSRLNFFSFHFFKDVASLTCHLHCFQHKIWCHLIFILLCCVLFLWSLLWFFSLSLVLSNLWCALVKFLVLGVSWAPCFSGLMFYLDLEYFQSLFFQILFSASPLPWGPKFHVYQNAWTVSTAHSCFVHFFLTFSFFSFCMFLLLCLQID